MSVTDAYFTGRKDAGSVNIPCIIYEGPDTDLAHPQDRLDIIIRRLIGKVNLIEKRLDDFTGVGSHDGIYGPTYVLTYD